MDPKRLRGLLDDVRKRRLAPDAALEQLARLPFEDLGFAQVDHHRAVRTGFPEAVFGAGKTPEQCIAIVERIAARGQAALVTRAGDETRAALLARFPRAQEHALARCVSLPGRRRTPGLRGRVAVVCAGTSDLPVAEEAALTAELYGAKVERISDVGVAGLHRLLGRVEALRAADVVIVAAGMEGALPSVVAGLVDAPVIAVPTSIGYGASFQGLAALLAMLNSCASGVAAVNIDNGFGAGVLAATMLRRLRGRRPRR
jgi:NCAIR mutase (PurE)-related protein